VDVVIPSAGRPSLARLLEALAAGRGPLPQRVLVVDDRGGRAAPLEHGRELGSLGERVELLRGPGRGPAAARNVGWRAASAEWVAFLDDDVVPTPGWRTALDGDLRGLDAGVGASQGRIAVPLPPHRRPTDWERNTAGLEGARWATADMAYRRAALAAVGGFDERFPRAYREDADLGLRVTRRGWRIVRGSRRVSHPARPADRWVSVRAQAGNADDVLMRALHGPGWRDEAGAPPGRLRRHLAVASTAVLAGGALADRRRRLAAAAAGLWLAGTAELALARARPGPRTPDELFTVVLTSAAIPLSAAAHWARGRLAVRRLARASAAPRPEPPQAVLLDRDGTLVVDVPYNGDPAAVRAMPGAAEAVRRLRAAGVPLAVVSNQSAVARGLLTLEQVFAVNRRVEELLGPLGPWLVCPHGADDGCDCRKPRAGLVLRAAERLGVDPRRCALIGDIGADVDAARAAGARAVLVPTARTLPEEVAAAPETAADLPSAVDLLLGEAA
jgi:histidinol-phosphate phosphatase family protein